MPARRSTVATAVRESAGLAAEVLDEIRFLVPNIFLIFW
jgi:hypothetical protein